MAIKVLTKIDADKLFPTPPYSVIPSATAPIEVALLKVLDGI